MVDARRVDGGDRASVPAAVAKSSARSCRAGRTATRRRRPRRAAGCRYGSRTRCGRSAAREEALADRAKGQTRGRGRRPIRPRRGADLADQTTADSGSPGSRGGGGDDRARPGRRSARASRSTRRPARAPQRGAAARPIRPPTVAISPRAKGASHGVARNASRNGPGPSRASARKTLSTARAMRDRSETDPGRFGAQCCAAGQSIPPARPASTRAEVQNFASRAISRHRPLAARGGFRYDWGLPQPGNASGPAMPTDFTPPSFSAQDALVASDDRGLGLGREHDDKEAVVDQPDGRHAAGLRGLRPRPDPGGQPDGVRPLHRGGP